MQEWISFGGLTRCRIIELERCAHIVLVPDRITERHWNCAMSQNDDEPEVFRFDSSDVFVSVYHGARLVQSQRAVYLGRVEYRLELFPFDLRRPAVIPVNRTKGRFRFFSKERWRECNSGERCSTKAELPEKFTSMFWSAFVHRDNVFDGDRL